MSTMETVDIYNFGVVNLRLLKATSDCAQHPTTTITAPKQSSWEEERTSTGMVHALLFVIKVERVALFPLSCLVFALRARW